MRSRRAEECSGPRVEGLRQVARGRALFSILAVARAMGRSVGKKGLLSAEK